MSKSSNDEEDFLSEFLEGAEELTKEEEVLFYSQIEDHDKKIEEKYSNNPVFRKIVDLLVEIVNEKDHTISDAIAALGVAMEIWKKKQSDRSYPG